MIKVLEYLTNKGWQHKKAGNQFCLKVCPLCGDEKWHFYISASTGAWDCKVCFSKGGLYQLKKELGDLNKEVKSVKRLIGMKEEPKPLDANVYLKIHSDLLNNKKAMSYLKNKRGLNDDTIKHFKLGLVKENGIEWLAVPHFIGSKLINIKYRSLPPADKKFKREPGKPSILFNEDCLYGDFSEVCITEGEVDAMSLWQAGFKNVVGTTAGAGSFPAEWHDKLEDSKMIYLCFDADDAGQKGSFTVADKLGFERCKNIRLPKGLDLNDYLKDHTREDFVRLVAQAKKFKVPDVLSIDDVFRRHDERRLNGVDKEGIITEWANVNKHIGSFKPGNLIIISAIAKTGKTTFCLNLVHHNALMGKPCFFFCIEMNAEEIVLKLSQLHFNRPIEDLDSLSDGDRESLSNIPIYFGTAIGSMDSKYVLEKIRSTVKRHDIELVVFDNLHYLVRDTRHVAQEIGIVTKGFKMLAEELEIPILLIAQPRKTQEGQMPSMMDLKDSSSIGTDSDQVIILWREVIRSKQTDPEELDNVMKAETVVRVDASRYGPGGQTVLYFDGAKSTFRRVSEQNEPDF